MAQAVQLAIEYDPEPPFDAGSPAKAGPELVAFVQAVMADPARRARRLSSQPRRAQSEVVEGSARRCSRVPGSMRHDSMNASTSARLRRMTRPNR